MNQPSPLEKADFRFLGRAGGAVISTMTLKVVPKKGAGYVRHRGLPERFRLTACYLFDRGAREVRLLTSFSHS